MTNKSENARNLLGIFGILLMFVGGLILLPLLALPFYRDELDNAVYFVIPAAAALLIGFLLKLLRPRNDIKLNLRQGAVVVLGIWVSAALFSSLPFILSGTLNFNQAYFEAMSGWTTTGLSVVDVTQAPHIFLLFRAIMQFFGGLGFVLIVVSALSETFGMRLYSAEGHSDKLLPNLAKSSRMIIVIYMGYFVAGTVLYVISGMPVFDAVNICMAALSTGGFAVTPDSIATYHSFIIELVTIVLMVLGATNFLIHLLLIRRKFRKIIKLSELKFMLFLLGLFIPLVAVVSLNGLYGSFGEALRVSLFNITSALTTTGFSTVSFNRWPSFAWLILIVMMLVGGGAGSTAGGIKYGRIYAMFKVLIWNIRRKFLPEHNVCEISINRPEGKVYIEPGIFSEAANYVFLYIVILLAGAGILAAHGYSFQDSLFEYASALGTVGLSVGVTAPGMPPAVLWSMTVGMLLGRLEIYVVFIGMIKLGKDIKTIMHK